MKVPLQWLADYVDLVVPPGELARRLTLAGLEVVGFRSYGLPVPEGLKVRQDEPGPVWDRDKVFTARLLRVDKHPDADKLKLPLVEYGQGRQIQLVTGAPNIAVGDAGQKVVIGLAGTTFWDGHVSPKKLATLVPKPVRGIPSEGMVLSNFELGINDEHEGILLLEEDAPVGVPFADYAGDIVLEIDVLPNMARCMALVGIAREVAALTGQKLKHPAAPVGKSGPAIMGRVEVRIEDAKLCPRYAAALIEGVSVGSAPGRMARRLTYAGMRPINKLVDVTNYVMLELGQPLHAFDYDILRERAGGKAPTIVVRPARAGETLTTLDGKERLLTPEMLVIADSQGPIALAGVMGGLETEVTARTRNVLLESASFDPVSIRRTARTLDLNSEASSRFVKGVHPELVPHALTRAAALMAQIAGGSVAAGSVDVYPEPLAPRSIELPLREIRRLLGVEVPLDECVRLLETLEFQVTPGSASLSVVVPGHRLDIQEGPADLIEEIARLRGYDDLPATLLAEPLPAQRGNEVLAFEERLKDLLVALGFQEAICYALTTPQQEAFWTSGPHVTLANPISSERTVLRRTLLPGLLEVTERNFKHSDAVRFFEIGSVYLPRDGQSLPDEPRRLALVLGGYRGVEHWSDGGTRRTDPVDFYDLKGVVESLLADLHVPASYQVGTSPAYHPGKCAEVRCGPTVLGVFGELHPRLAARFGLSGKAVLAAEFDLQALQAVVPPRFAYVPLATFPAAKRDVAVIVSEQTTCQQVETEIRAGGGALLREVVLFDVYRGESIPAGSKSLAFALTFQADDRTLSDKEIDKAFKAVQGRLTHVLKATIRDHKA